MLRKVEAIPNCDQRRHYIMEAIGLSRTRVTFDDIARLEEQSKGLVANEDLDHLMMREIRTRKLFL